MSNPADSKRQALDNLEELLGEIPSETPWKLVRTHLRQGMSTRTLIDLEHRIEGAIEIALAAKPDEDA